MEGVFKFGRNRHVRQLAEEGVFLLSSLTYFEHWETVWRQRGIGDETEGVSVLTINGEQDPGARPDIFHGLVSGPTPSPGAFTFKDSVIYRADPHALIFSAAHGKLEALEPIYGRFGYDAAAEIFDPVGFCEALIGEGVVHRSGRPLNEVLKQGGHGPIRYGSKTRDIAEIVRPDGGPFVKSSWFEEQSEYRFHFESTETCLADRLLVRLPRPERFISRDIVPIVAAEATSESAPQPIDNPLEAARRLLAESGGTSFPLTQSRAHELIRRLGTPPQDWSPEQKAEVDRLWADDGRRTSEAYAASQERFGPDVLRLMWAIRLQFGIREPYNLPYRPGVKIDSLKDLVHGVAEIEAGRTSPYHVRCDEFYPVA